MTASAYSRLQDCERRGVLKLAAATRIRGEIVMLAAHEPSLPWWNVRRLLAQQLGVTATALIETAPWARRLWVTESVRAFFQPRLGASAGRRRVTGYRIARNAKRVHVWLKDGSEEAWRRIARTGAYKLEAFRCWEAKR